MTVRSARQPRAWVGPALVAITLGLVAGQGSSASGLEGGSLPQQSTTGPDTWAGPPVRETELEDLEAVAAQKGISLEATIKRYAWNDDLGFAVDEIREAFPDDFATAQIIDAENAWIGFANEAPSGALELLERFMKSHPWIVINVVEGIGFSEVVLEQAIPAVYFAVYGSDGISDASTTFDFNTMELSTVVALDAGGRHGLLEDLRALQVTALEDIAIQGILNHVALTLVASDLPVLGGNSSNTQHRGGEVISGCTSGFVFVSPAGDRGIVTAGHCYDVQSDDGVNLPFLLEHQGTHGDFQMHNGSQARPNSFYSGSTTQLEVNSRAVTAVGIPSVGQTLCRNGKTTFKICQEVRKLSVCHSGACNLVQMETKTHQGGDSGGPYCWSNTAYGIVKGWHTDPLPFGTRDTFSKASRLFNAFGVWVATS